MRRGGSKFPDNGFEAWGGYMQAKISKLEEQFCLEADKDIAKVSNIFKGISIYVNGYTKPSADELKSLMAKHGGVYHTYQRQDDYMIACNLPDTKVKKMCLSKVVRPEWITDSIAAGSLLDYRNYLLYTNSKLQSRLNFEKSEIVGGELKNLPFFSSEPADSEVKKLPNNPNNSSLTESKSIKTANDPNFISEFYNKSRLHHISQLGACFKQYINELRENSNYLFPDREHLKNHILQISVTDNNSQIDFQGGKTIMHIDMDCFFVSVGLRTRPDLLGKCVAVTHSKGGQMATKREGVNRNAEFNLYKQNQAKKLGKAIGVPEEKVLNNMETRVDNITEEGDKFGSMSEIASCSYEARSKGVKNGMFMGNALRICRDLQTLPYDFEGYKEVAYTLYDTIAKYTLDIEAVSCDEMYVDCTEVLKRMNVSVQSFATALREEIKMKTGCPCSAGFGGNRLQARLATKRAKPDGQFFLFSDLVTDYIYDIELKDLPGVGRQTAQKLQALGHTTCGSLQSLPLNTLQQHLGQKTGLLLYEQCRGQDSQPLTFLNVRKSVSAEVNYGIRFENDDQCFEFIKQLSVEVESRMQQCRVKGKCITLKLMIRAADAPVETAKFLGHGYCDVVNKSVTTNSATNDAHVIMQEIISIIKKLKVEVNEIRGVGIQITKLEPIAKEQKGAISKFLLPKSASSGSTNVIKSEIEMRKSLPDSPIRSEQQKHLQISPSKRNSREPKSPVIKHSKSPTVRRRGRPPKNSIFKKELASKNLLSTFLSKQNHDFYYTAVREESCSSDYVPTSSPKTDKVKTETHLNTRLDLLDLSWQEVKELMRAWLDSRNLPLQCDVKLISTYMCNLVIQKHIEKVNILLNFLCRKCKEVDNEYWMEVSADILEEVQNAMIAVYGKKLNIE